MLRSPGLRSLLLVPVVTLLTACVPSAEGQSPALIISDEVAEQLVLSGAHALQEGKERFWCLEGIKSPSGAIIVQRAFMPAQVATQDSVGYYIAPVDAKQSFCPSHATVADMHTHPIEWKTGPFPSIIDIRAWRRDPYDWHFLSYPIHDQDQLTVTMIAWRRVKGTQEFAPYYSE